MAAGWFVFLLQNRESGTSDGRSLPRWLPKNDLLILDWYSVIGWWQDGCHVAAKEPICWYWTDDLLILNWESAISSADDVQYYSSHVDIWEQRIYLISWWCRIVAAWNRFAVDKEPRNQLMKHVADTEQACSCWTKNVCSAYGTWLLWSALINRREAKFHLKKPLANRRISFLWQGRYCMTKQSISLV